MGSSFPEFEPIFRLEKFTDILTQSLRLSLSFIIIIAYNLSVESTTQEREKEYSPQGVTYWQIRETPLLLPLKRVFEAIWRHSALFPQQSMRRRRVEWENEDRKWSEFMKRKKPKEIETIWGLWWGWRGRRRRRGGEIRGMTTEGHCVIRLYRNWREVVRWKDDEWEWTA